MKRMRIEIKMTLMIKMKSAAEEIPDSRFVRDGISSSLSENFLHTVKPLAKHVSIAPY